MVLYMLKCPFVIILGESGIIIWVKVAILKDFLTAEDLRGMLDGLSLYDTQGQILNIIDLSVRKLPGKLQINP